MSELSYVIVNVFTQQLFGGNPLAVFKNADSLSGELMQAIAKQLNLSETTFVVPSNRADCDFRVRIFTPNFEIPMAGHPTLGTAFVVSPNRKSLVFEEGVGPIPVNPVQKDGVDMWQMKQPEAQFFDIVDDVDCISRALGVAPLDLELDKLPAQPVATGVPFLMICVKDQAALKRIYIKQDEWRRVQAESRGAYIYTVLQEKADEIIVQARLLGVDGIFEDPATGSAAGPLASYLDRYGQLQGKRLIVRQGIEMQRPSEIYVELDESKCPLASGASIEVG